MAHAHSSHNIHNVEALMRVQSAPIQKPVIASLKFEQARSSMRQVDSLQGLASQPSRLCRRCAALWRTLSNFFRGILSSCFSIAPRCSVAKNEIAYSRSEIDEKGAFKYQILLDEVGTKNEIKFTKINEKLHILEFTFPDDEMREHIPSILEHILDEEKAVLFTTEYLDRAQLLWRCAFTTESKITFDPQGLDDSNKFIRAVIEKAQEKKDALHDEYLEALKRMERVTDPSTVSLDMAVSLFQSCVMMNKSKKISLSDLLMVMEGLDIECNPGVRFGNLNMTKLADFKKGPDLEIRDFHKVD